MHIVHLHTHSHYSLLDGLAKIPELVMKAQEVGSPALALTDHGSLYGAIEFYKACKEAGIKPIIGCELYVAPRALTDREANTDRKPYHLTVLAKNMQGYKNLIKLVTIANLQGFYYKPRVDKELLKKNADGLIILSGCLASEFGRAARDGDTDKALAVAKEYMGIVGKDNYYIEIQPHQMADQLKANSVAHQVAKRIGRPVAVTNDIHYLNKEDEETHEVLLSINTGKDVDDAERMSLKGASVYMMTPEEILQALPNQEASIEETLKIAEKTQIDFEFGTSILPEFPLPAGETDTTAYLHKLTKEGLKKFYAPEMMEQAQKRLDYELSVIEKTGFGDYFLIVSDIVRWAKNAGIGVGPGRGSAAGSIVAYVLEITALDPLAYNLIFERFLNPDRISMPDIDLDFGDDRRGEVIDYIKQRYGDDHVAQIITFGVMKARLSVRDVTRSLALPYSLGDQIAKLIPVNVNLKEALTSVADLKALYESDPDAQKVLTFAQKLEGVVRHASTHAAGVVISKEPLVEYVPLQKSTTHSTRLTHSTGSGQAGDGEGVTTQFDMKMVEAIGLLKMDILGLANLTIMQNALRIIRKIDNKDIDIQTIPLDDKKTFQMLARAETVGVFQLESAGMQRYLRELKPTEIEDIISMVALYRPGPMDSIPDFIEGKHARKKITYLHPSLEPILKSTYGVIVTQDQVLEIARLFAGFTYGEADILRKAVGKKIKKMLDEQKEKFISGAMHTQAIDRDAAARVWDFIEPFARYGFNRAHAACYAFISYQTAYLKANFPHQFMAALLTSEHKNLDKVAVAIAECERMGMTVMPPDINQSFVEFGVVDSKLNPEHASNESEMHVERVENIPSDTPKRVIRFGLGAIKNVGEKAAALIVDERTAHGVFTSLEDFLTRIGGQVINKKVVESLAKSGALQTFAETNKILGGIDTIVKYSQQANKEKSTAQGDLFGSVVTIDVGTLDLPDASPASKKIRLAWEKEFLGIYVSEHPLKGYVTKMPHNVTPLGSLSSEKAETYVRVAGIAAQTKAITTKSNQKMAFMQFEDLSGSLEAVVFPSVLEKYASLLESNAPLVLDGRVNMKDGSIKLIVSAVYGIDDELPDFVRNNGNGGGHGNGYGNGNGYRSGNGDHTSGNNAPKIVKKDPVVVLTLPHNARRELLTQIKTCITGFPGDVPVRLLIPQNGTYHEVNIKTKITPDNACINQLKTLVGENNVQNP